MSVFAPGLFEGQVALVTGGGTGIGWATTKLLASLGARVAIVSRSMEHLERAAKELLRTGADPFVSTCDIREVEQIGATVDAVKARFGRIDVLVNNAGGQFPTAAEALTPKGWEAVIRNNLNGTWFMTHAVGTRAMIPQKSGIIVNVIANVVRGFPGMIHTGAARAGVENMTRTLAVEWATYGIRVNCIAPGIIETEGLAQYPEIVRELGRKRAPMKRMGTPEEVANGIVFLASRAASFVTGATLLMTGGADLHGDTWIIPD